MRIAECRLLYRLHFFCRLHFLCNFHLQLSCKWPFCRIERQLGRYPTFLPIQNLAAAISSENQEYPTGHCNIIFWPKYIFLFSDVADWTPREGSNDIARWPYFLPNFKNMVRIGFQGEILVFVKFLEIGLPQENIFCNKTCHPEKDQRTFPPKSNLYFRWHWWTQQTQRDRISFLYIL